MALEMCWALIVLTLPNLQTLEVPLPTLFLETTSEFGF